MTESALPAVEEEEEEKEKEDVKGPEVSERVQELEAALIDDIPVDAPKQSRLPKGRPYTHTQKKKKWFCVCIM